MAKALHRGNILNKLIFLMVSFKFLAVRTMKIHTSGYAMLFSLK
jgi:hypothetical protein